MKGFLALLLLGCAYGASLDRQRHQVFGNNLFLESSRDIGSLPPVNVPCVPLTSYRTQTQFSTEVIPSIVYNNDVRYLTQTSFRTQQVYTTVHSEVVKTEVVPQIQFRTVTVTRTEQNVRTQVVTLPPQVNYVTQTQQDVRTQVQYQTQFITRTQEVPSTVTRNVVSTQVVPQQVISTIYQTQTVIRTQQLPGETRTVQRTQYSTVYSTIVQPGQDVVRTQIVTRTNYQTITRTEPGQTEIVTSIQVVPVTTTIVSEEVVTNTQTQFVTRTRFQQQVSTVHRTQQVPQFNTRTVTVPSQVVQTQYSTHIVSTTFFTRQDVPTVINVPAETQFVTVTRTAVRTQHFPGQTRTQFVTRTAYNIRYITSTVYNQQHNIVTVTRTTQPQCNTGYNYPTPSRGLNPFSG